MNRLSLLVAFAAGVAGMVGAAYGQSAIVSPQTLVPPAFQATPYVCGDSVKQSVAAAPAGGALRLSYYDTSRRILAWPCAVNVGSATVFVLGERMTLPTTYGHLDSIAFLADSVVGDSLEIGIQGDSLYNTGAGQFHLINAWDIAATTYFDTTISMSSVGIHGWTTVPVPHAIVPQQFYVTLVPHVANNTFTSWYWLASDSEDTRVRTAENCRSAMLYTAGQNVFSGVFDSTLILNASMTQPAFVNFYIAAYVDTVMLSGVHAAAPRAGMALATFPDPCVDGVRISAGGMSGRGGELRIYDALGRMVADLSAQIREGQAMWDTRGMSTGLYVARLRNGSVEAARTIRVVR